MKQVRNTTGKGENFLSLDYVLDKYRKMGHEPKTFNCDCCYFCGKCDKDLLDDLRTECHFDECCEKILGYE